MILSLVILLPAIVDCADYQKPNIVLVLADDIGYNDVSWNNNLAKTPNMQKLAEEGVILDNAYSMPVCTPSRAALMTGIYPFKLGLQRGFGKQTPEGIPVNTTLLPQILREQGYTTHGLGKWHLGFCSPLYTPTERGFDSYFGFFVGDDDDNIDAGPKNSNDSKEKKVKRHNERNKLKAKRKKKRKKEKLRYRYSRMPRMLKEELKYQTELYTKKAAKIIESSKSAKPFFIYLSLFTKSYPRIVRKHDFRGTLKNAHSEDHQQKISDLDNAFELLVNTLKRTGHYENTIMMFLSDNGGRTVPNQGRRTNPNYPFRGAKGTLYEGGTKVPGFVHSPLLKNMTGRKYEGLFHLVDVLPTLTNSREDNMIKSSIDGINQWSAISGASPAPRHVMVYNIDDDLVPTVLKGPHFTPKFQIVIREDNYKLIWGQSRMMHRY